MCPARRQGVCNHALCSVQRILLLMQEAEVKLVLCMIKATRKTRTLQQSKIGQLSSERSCPKKMKLQCLLPRQQQLHSLKVLLLIHFPPPMISAAYAAEIYALSVSALNLVVQDWHILVSRIAFNRDNDAGSQKGSV